MITSFRDIMTIRKKEPPILRVCDPILKSSATSKHHEYNVTGTIDNVPFEVYRRFKQFNLLREVLFQRFPGLYVPPMPPKKKLVHFKKYIHIL
jgi:hypothetical protein